MIGQPEVVKQERVFLDPSVVVSNNAKVRAPWDIDFLIEKTDEVWGLAAKYYFRFADELSDKILYMVNRGSETTEKDERQAKLTVYRITIIAATLGAGFIGLNGGIIAGAASLAARIGLIYFSTRALDEGCKNDLRTSFAKETYQTVFYISAFSVAARLTGGLLGLAALTGAVYFATKAEDETNSPLSKPLNYAGVALCTLITISEMSDVERIAAGLFQTTLHALTVAYAYFRTEKRPDSKTIELEAPAAYKEMTEQGPPAEVTGVPGSTTQPEIDEF